jgi:4-hydroxy-2-oxoheptanedioate aldolase
MRENTALTKWRAGEPTFGTWLSIPSSVSAEVMARQGFDWISIDMQHGMIDYVDAVPMLQAISQTDCIPFVRVPWNDFGIIGKILDAGAMGVIIPMVNTVDEARRAVAACRYAPVGSRSFGPLGVATRLGPAYVGAANESIACIPMIETRQAVEAVDDILAVPGIDAVYIGPADLSLTYGLDPAHDHPGDPFQGALATVVAACSRRGVVPGIHANAALAAARHATGFRMITVGFDALPAITGLRADAAAARAAVSA